MRVASLMKERLQDLARTITPGEDTIIAEAHLEIDRASETIILAEEAKRPGSEGIPLYGPPGPDNRFGFTLRGPCRVVQFEPRLRSLRTGNPPDEIVAIGPMVRGKAAVRVRESIRDDAIARANDISYGLSALVLAKNLDNAMRFAREVDSGNIHISWDTHSRADLMTDGGLKEGGFGEEGRRDAVRAMTETKNGRHLPPLEPGFGPRYTDSGT